ncbi:MAG: hypothetical protein R3E62_10310 [Pseudomonadales bacterium]
MSELNVIVKRLPMLETLTVYVLAIESPGIYSRQTIDIYSDSRRTIWHFAVGEALYAACATEKMLDSFIVKKVFCKRTLSRL